MLLMVLVMRHCSVRGAVHPIRLTDGLLDRRLALVLARVGAHRCHNNVLDGAVDR